MALEGGRFCRMSVWRGSSDIIDRDEHGTSEVRCGCWVGGGMDVCGPSTLHVLVHRCTEYWTRGLGLLGGVGVATVSSSGTNHSVARVLDFAFKV